MFRRGSHPIGEMPTLADWAWPDLERRAAELKAQYLIRCHALEQISAALSTARLDVLVVKGASLAETLYPTPWSRPMEDIDLIVRPGKLQAVRRALTGAMFVDRPLVERPLTEASLEVAVMSPKGPGSVLVELHEGLDKVAPRRIDLSGLFRRAKMLASYEGLLAPDPFDHLFLVVLHLAGDEFRHATGFVDLEVILSSGVDQQRLVAEARSWSAKTAAWVALRVLDRMKPGIVVREVLERLEPDRLRRQAIATSFDPDAWPVARRGHTGGMDWAARQTLLRDDSSNWLAGLAIYGGRRVLERARLRLRRA